MTRTMHPFHRTELLVGGDGMDRLTTARVAVIGLGGIGGHAAEALARSGVGKLALVDFDKVCVTNVNRQIHATRKTVGKPKAELMAERVAAINPKCDVVGHQVFYEAETSDMLLGPLESPIPYDFVIDCIDNMTAKVHLVEACVRRSTPILVALGAGGRMDPTRVRVSDIGDTYNDPFARILREQLRNRGIETGVECVWTDELPNDLDADAKARFRCICPGKDENTKHSCERRMQVQGSVAWMPAIFGLTLAAVAVGHLVGQPVAHKVDRPKQGRRRKAAVEIDAH